MKNEFRIETVLTESQKVDTINRMSKRHEYRVMQTEKAEFLAEELAKYLDLDAMQDPEYKNVDVKAFCLKALDGFMLKDREELKRTRFWDEALKDFEEGDQDTEDEARRLYKQRIVKKNLSRIIKEAIKINVEGYAESVDAEMPSIKEMKKLMAIRLYNTDEAVMITDQIVEKLVKIDE